MKKHKLIALTAAAAFLLSGCDFFPSLNPFAVTSIELNTDTVRLVKGETFQLEATVSPDSALNKELSWSSSARTTASVSSSGKITAKNAGEATITVSATDGSGVKTECYVKVTNSVILLTEITISTPKSAYTVGDEFVKPTVTAHYADDSTQDVTNLATFTGYSMKTAGRYTVTVRYEERDIEKSVSYPITVARTDGTIPETTDIDKTKLQSDYSDYVQNNIYDLDSAPCTGKAKLLVIPVWFNDSSKYISTAKKETVRSDIEAAYFGTNSETGWRSVKTFYEEESHGRLSLTGTVSEWWSCGYNASTFYSEDDGAENTSSLVVDAVDWYFKNHSDSRKDYDCDGNGHLDGVMLIYAAPDYFSLRNNSAGNLWAYAFWLQGNNPSSANPTPNVFFWASYDFMYDPSTCTSKTGVTSYTYGAGDCSHCKVDSHTFIHEMGHVFGLEDYYDYSDLNYSPAGQFSMQDHNVGMHDPYSCMALGWADPYIPTTTSTITISPFASSGDLILLTPTWNSYDSPFDEYLLLELFTPTGLNEMDCTYQYDSRMKGPSKAGIRVWHVDARLVATDNRGYLKSGTYTNPLMGNVYHAMSNSYDDGYISESRLSPLGSDYYNYNVLQVIKNSSSATYKESTGITNSDLFIEGSTFSMSNFSRQFVNGTKLNSKTNLGWSFVVEECSSSGATIKVTRG